MSEDMIYKKMYLHLFNAVTDALEIMEDYPKMAKKALMQAQVYCEDMYICCEDEAESSPRIIKFPVDNKHP